MRIEIDVESLVKETLKTFIETKINDLIETGEIDKIIQNAVIKLMERYTVWEIDQIQKEIRLRRKHKK